MTLLDMFGKVAESIENVSQIREVVEATNRVISDINAKWPGELHTDEITRIFANTLESCSFSTSGDYDTITTETNLQAKGLGNGGIIYISGSTYGKNNGPKTVKAVHARQVTIEDDNILTIETTEVTVSAYTLINALYPDTSSLLHKDYIFNSRNNEITIDPKLKKILGIFNNNVELERKDRQYVKDTNNKSEYCYAMVGRSTILLPESVFSNEEDLLSIKMLKKIPQITTISTLEEIDIPLGLEGMLFSGVMVCLLAKPQYINEPLSELHTGLYSTELAALSRQEYDRLENTSRDLNYKY
ncbi:MAG: hypothetical protein CMB80_02180 [Flammeovirgaceae bacterium]|nr:hypothetical protein [Flammeovirgaceae bacterium]